MKKFHLVALLGLFAAFCGFVFTSCGDDDEGDSSNPIVGTWTLTENNSEQNMSFSQTYSFTFTSDGKYTMLEEGQHKSPDFEEKFGSRETGTYKLDGNTLTLTPTGFAYLEPDGKWYEEENREGEPWTQEIAIENKTLYIAFWQGGEQMALKKK